MKSNKCKKIILFCFIFLASSQISVFAKHKNPYEGEVDAPSSESVDNVSEGVIIYKNPFEEYTPTNPIKEGVINEEYSKADTYVIDLKTIENRIKYFSPTYKNIKQSAESSYWMAFFARGGNDTLMFDSKHYTEEINDLMVQYRQNITNSTSLRNTLNKSDKDYNDKYRELSIQIETYKAMYNAVSKTYFTTNATITNTKSMLGLGNALYNIGNVDNNNKVAFARRSVTKAISSVVLTYMQLNTYVDILEKQSNLYYDMYALKLKNYQLGLATSLDVSTSLDSYENARSTLNSTKTTLKNVKEQIAINLGYDLNDIDKLVFVEPEVDFDYISTIDFVEDKKRVFTSNSAYNSIKLSDKDKKYPQSTGEDIFNKRREYTANLIIAEFENIYENLKAQKLLFDSSMYLNEICAITDEANKRKLETNLINELEYKGLEIQNIGNKLQVKVAKYNLINAINTYYFAALGDLTIN